MKLVLLVLALCVVAAAAQQNPCGNGRPCNVDKKHQTALSWSIDPIPYSYKDGRRCAHKNGIFCADNMHCCPNAMKCSVNGNDTPKCMPDLLLAPGQSGSIMEATPIISPPGVEKTAVEKCIDARSCSHQKWLP